MNKKFFALPIQKQEAILNAGFCVFSQNSYKKSLQVKLPMLQVSVNPCCFTIFTTKENCIFFYGKNVRRLPWKLWKKAAVMSRLICSIP